VDGFNALKNKVFENIVGKPHSAGGNAMLDDAGNGHWNARIG
jgi:hypothetical protein